MNNARHRSLMAHTAPPAPPLRPDRRRDHEITRILADIGAFAPALGGTNPPRTEHKVALIRVIHDGAAAYS
jgi:hypothetical protein